jgi:hypothetical protein
VFVDITQTLGFHSLGPGLEIEVDAARLGDLMLSVYTFGRAYKLLGSRRLEFENVAVWEVEGGGSTMRAPTTVTSVYERDPWHYALGVGVRFLWRPE